MLPNLLIIGSIKGGTTSLQHYLDQHPQISMWNRVLAPAVRRLPEDVQEPVRRRTIRALSRKIEVEPAIDDEALPRLRTIMRDEADRLRALTGKPFSSWCV